MEGERAADTELLGRMLHLPRVSLVASGVVKRNVVTAMVMVCYRSADWQQDDDWKQHTILLVPLIPGVSHTMLQQGAHE